MTKQAAKKQQDILDFGEPVDKSSARGRLQHIAARLFKQKGYSQTTVRDIAAEVGIQSGSIFHHFNNKEEILRSVMVDAILQVLKSMKVELEISSDPKARLHGLILCELKAIHDEQLSGFQLLISEWRSLGESNQFKILSLRERYEQLWLEVLDSAHDAKIVSTESLYLRGFIRGALIETSNWFKPSGSIGLDELAHKLMVSLVAKN